ncbi:sugar ABC transporter substrate-binding protein [Streptomyces sp. NBC_00006]|uniref:ABC transporter substrate-binding protein n=1 Tax=Streptomyces sp. NBC_00006 TaxID=2975619 RepID=UPI0022554926|nr:sugar ABC transporter substrate-binding protein [Streptomyces sp. NBC_00006]MCX5530143.1 sugar ABC transporter substrate-binding protein [Streptomyces sp. NBC_00006]
MAGASAMVLLLSSCAFAENTGVAGGDPNKLTFWLSGDTAQGGGFAKMAAEYTKETGVEVEVVDIPYDDLVTKMRNAAMAGELPALARVPGIDPIWSGALMDLGGVAKDHQIKKDLLAANEKGVVNALPTDLTAVGLFVNKSLFKKAHVDYPRDSGGWTWDQFVAAVKKVQKRTDAKYGMVTDASSHRLRSFMYQFGGNGFREGRDGEFKGDAASVKALKRFKELNDGSFSPKSVWLSNDDPNAMFKSGRVVAYYSGVWQIADFAKNIKNFDWDSALMPHQPVRTTNLGTNYLVGFDGPAAKKSERFVNWLYTKKNYRKLCETSGFLPVEDGVQVRYAARQRDFDLYNRIIDEAGPLGPAQIKDSLRQAYAGHVTEGDPLHDETVKYLGGSQSLDATVGAIEKQLNEQLGDG